MQTKSGGLLASCILLIISMELKGLGVFWRGHWKGSSATTAWEEKEEYQKVYTFKVRLRKSIRLVQYL